VDLGEEMVRSKEMRGHKFFCERSLGSYYGRNGEVKRAKSGECEDGLLIGK
jgi:hypothetical protein